MTLDEQTFAQFATVWEERRGRELANAYDNKHRLRKICNFQLPGAAPPTTFGQKLLTSITTDDVEAYRDHRKTQGLSPVTVNRPTFRPVAGKRVPAASAARSARWITR